MDYSRARKQMVDTQLLPTGVTDRELLAAFGTVPRERFVPPGRRDLAYIDDAQLLSVSKKRYLPPAAPVARLLQLADLAASDKVMIVGAGTGYSAAILTGLVSEIVALEPDPELAEAARRLLAALNIRNVDLRVAPLADGAPDRAPFDFIWAEGAVDAVPQALLQQLATGGRLATFIRQHSVAVAHIFTRTGDEIAALPAFEAAMPRLELVPRVDSFVF